MLNEEREFSKIFTSKMYAGNTKDLNERLNAVGRLLTRLFVLVDRNKCRCCGYTPER